MDKTCSLEKADFSVISLLLSKIFVLLQLINVAFRLLIFRCCRLQLLRYFVTIVVLVLALNVHAQDEDEDVAYSLNLAETVVLADGTTFEEYLLKQVLANAKPLKERVRALRYSVTCQLEKDIDLTTFPHRRTITLLRRRT